VELREVIITPPSLRDTSHERAPFVLRTFSPLPGKSTLRGRLVGVIGESNKMQETTLSFPANRFCYLISLAIAANACSRRTAFLGAKLPSPIPLRIPREVALLINSAAQSLIECESSKVIASPSGISPFL